MRTLIIGASTNKDRYSYKAIQELRKLNFDVCALGLNEGKIIKFMKADKKNKSKNINLILLKDIGKPILNLTFDHNKIYSFLKRELMN